MPVALSNLLLAVGVAFALIGWYAPAAGCWAAAVINQVLVELGRSRQAPGLPEGPGEYE